MTPVDNYVRDLVTALGIEALPLDGTRLTDLAHLRFIERLRSATLSYLACPAAFSTNTRLLSGDNEVPRDRWTHSRMGHGQVIHTQLLNDYIDDAVVGGQLLVVDSVDECDPLLMRLREALEYRLQARAWINVYLTAASATNFGLHSDTHDTIIIQLFGNKMWHVDGQPRGLPPGMTLEDLACFEMAVPKILAIPGGTAHHVTGVGQLALHLTIGFDRDLGLTPRLRELDDLMGRSSPEITEDDRAHGLAMTPDRRAGSSLPFIATRDLADCSHVRWASRLPPVVTRSHDGTLTVASMGRSHTYTRSLEPIVLALVSGQELTGDELLALSGLSHEALRAFLLAGVGDGILICRV